MVFLFGGDARVLLSALEVNPQMKITLQDSVGNSNSVYTSVFLAAFSFHFAI